MRATDFDATATRSDTNRIERIAIAHEGEQDHAATPAPAFDNPPRRRQYDGAVPGTHGLPEEHH